MNHGAPIHSNTVRLGESTSAILGGIVITSRATGTRQGWPGVT